MLQKIGCGSEIKHSGIVTSYTNDRGIDGIIKEDVLGLGRIHIQAKRYLQPNSVGREEIQKCVDALAVAQSNKDVFYYCAVIFSSCCNLRRKLEWRNHLNTY